MPPQFLGNLVIGGWSVRSLRGRRSTLRKRRRYQAQLLTLAMPRESTKASVELPRDFKMPSRKPIAALRAALANTVGSRRWLDGNDDERRQNRDRHARTRR